MGNFSFGLLGEFESILPNEIKQSPEIYLQGIDREILLKTGSFLLGFNPATTPFRDWKTFINMWFQSANYEFARKVHDNCLRLERQTGEEVALYYNIAALRFFEFAFSLPQVQVTQTPEESEINIFKAYLTFVSKSTEHHTKSSEFILQHPDHNKAVLSILNMMFPTADLENYDLDEIIVCQVVKAAALFHFLESTPRTLPLLQQFYQHFKINNWKDFFQLILPIMKACTHRAKEGWLELVIKKDKDYEQSTHFLQLLSLQVFNEEDNPDFIQLRASPIYKVAEGRYCIISPLFVAEKIYKSLFFHLKELNDQLPVDAKIPEFRSFYGENFTENFLLYEILGFIYEKRKYTKFSGLELSKTKKMNGGPDYYIRNGNHVFLFENKDVFVGGKVKSSGDMETILSELQKKLYYYVKSDGKIAPKAVQQITENVRRILVLENKFDQNYKPTNVQVYPILVLNDTSFNVPGLNRIVNDWFRIELDKLKQNGYLIDRVKPVTIINIDTLILYSEYLRRKKESLDELVIAYHKAMSFPSKKEFKSEIDARNFFGNKNQSFARFMDNHTNLGYKQMGKGLVGVAMERIFPQIQRNDQG